MKSIRITGLCLVAMFVVSMVAAASASAVPTWKLGGEEITGTKSVTLEGTLKLKDTKTVAGVSEIECSFSTTGNEGAVGPGKYGRITKATVEISKCKPVKVCEKVEDVKALNLPWQTELYEEAGKIRDKVTQAAGTGKEPGWLVKCKVLILSKTDECTNETNKAGGWTAMTNKSSVGNVQATFTAEAPKAYCTEGKNESGEVLGSVQIKTASGVLSVS